MLSSLLRSALVLAAVCCLSYAESVITCEDRMQRLSCDQGVVSVLTVAYGRTDRQTCSEGRPPGQLDNTACSQGGALEALANRCNGRRICEVDKAIFSDPCPGTYKYIQTTYTCLPAHRVVACEESEVELSCDAGQTIAFIGAFYGRADRTTCIYGRPDGQVNKITCFNPTANRVVAERCNGKSRCSVYALNSVFQDPCFGTAKYLELAYTCQYPL
ncbi:L-rhamnose-binding lectin CSL2-like [Gadus macrocephalus]|uniref:L-rhamnose-binding lectin CSL2-like n=1 Tax=Gadus macrocephalus TaxID=80720 RepID=UPI0028CB773E|nr:L-rhamnose-binding lectin CSL2-like [Gadus macrocephalus]